MRASDVEDGNPPILIDDPSLAHMQAPASSGSQTPDQFRAPIGGIRCPCKPPVALSRLVPRKWSAKMCRGLLAEAAGKPQPRHPVIGSVASTYFLFFNIVQVNATPLAALGPFSLCFLPRNLFFIDSLPACRVFLCSTFPKQLRAFPDRIQPRLELPYSCTRPPYPALGLSSRLQRHNAGKVSVHEARRLHKNCRGCAHPNNLGWNCHHRVLDRSVVSGVGRMGRLPTNGHTSRAHRG